MYLNTKEKNENTFKYGLTLTWDVFKCLSDIKKFML